MRNVSIAAAFGAITGAAVNDFVFKQFHPVLRAAKPKRS